MFHEAFLSPEVWMLVAIGSVVGYLVGILPGLDSVVALALSAPIGLYLDADLAFYYYAALLGAVTFAGSVPAILFSIPGEPFSVVTTFDGFPMSRQGRAMEAMAISAVASALGAFISVGLLLLSLPIASKIVLLFGPGEKFWLVIWAFILVPFLSGKDPLKGLVSVSLGLVLSFVGRSVVTGQFRYTFGADHLASGLGTVQFLAIGVFALRVILEMMSEPEKPVAVSRVKVDRHQMWKGVRHVLRRPGGVARSSVIGTVVGAIPGLGPVTASFLSYLAARGASKSPETFGQGNPDGVLAPEAANNAVQGGSGVTSLLLGIPGSLDWAILLGIMVMYGITPGPDLIHENPHVVVGIIGGIVAGNAIASTVGLLAGTQLARLTGIRPLYVTPVIFATCMAGAFLLHNVVWDCMIALIGGVLGYFIHKLNYELLPFGLGFILGPFIETNFYQGLQVGLGTYAVFYESHMSIGLIVLCAATLAIGPWLRRRIMRG